MSRLAWSLRGVLTKVLTKALVAIVAAAVVACAGLGGAPSQALRVSLADLGVDEIGLLEQRLRLHLRLQNPNDVAIGINGLSYTLEINGRHFADGVSDQHLDLPRFSDARLQVAAVTGLGGVLRQWLELQKGGRDAIVYRLSGRLNLQGGASVPFDHQGEVPLPEVLRTAPATGRGGA